jgi:uncharacterized protein
MTDSVTPSFAAVEAALRRVGSHSDAAEAHGSLCGLACALGDAARSEWLTAVLEGGDAPAQDAKGILGSLASGTCSSLAEGDMSFRPLLPPDAEPLAVRADCLALWCQGFNHGLATGAHQRDANAALARGVTEEIVRDFTEMSRVAFGEDEAESEGEAAYAELVEYIRVSVQLVFEEFGDLRQRVARAGMH